jgi:RHS repeat-associated protein
VLFTKLFGKRRRSKTRRPASGATERRRRFVPELELLEKRVLLTYDIVFNSNFFPVKIASGIPYTGPYAEFKDPDDSGGAGAYSVYYNWYGVGTGSGNGYGTVSSDGNGWLGIYAPARTFTTSSAGPIAWIYDTAGGSAAEGSSHLTLHVYTNTPPTITNPGNQTNAEGDHVSKQISGSDADGDNITYSASNLPDGLSISSSGLISGTVSYAAAEISGGSYNVTVTGDDGHGGIGHASFTWTIADTNQPPVVTKPADRTSAEGATVSLQVAATDPDNDHLTYSATGLPDGLSINSTGAITGTISYSAAETNSGSYSVTVTATDNHSASDSKTFTWTITDTNRPPVVTKPADQTSAEGAAVTLQVAASDPDNDHLTYSATGLPGGLSINSTGAITGTISYSAAETNNGNYSVTVTATDNHGASDSKTFAWTVTNTNQPPVVIDPGDQENAEGDVVSLKLNASDPDGDSFTVSADGLPTGLSIDASGLITGTVDYSAAETNSGIYDVTVSATDTEGAVGSQEFTWTITNTNRPPTIANNGASGANEGSTATNGGTYSDPDPDNNVVLRASIGTVTGGGINSGAWVWSFRTADGPAENQTVTITADDGHGGITTTSFPLTVQNVSPTITPPNDQLAVQGVPVSFALGSFRDPGVSDSPWSVSVDWGDGSDPTTFQTSSQGAIPSATHTYALAPNLFTVTETVTDKDGGSDTKSFYVQVISGFSISGSITTSQGVYTAEADLSSDPAAPPPTGWFVTWPNGDVTTSTYPGYLPFRYPFSDGMPSGPVIVTKNDSAGSVTGVMALAIEGQTYDGLVAIYSSGGAAASGGSVTISWGDGTSSAGSLNGGAVYGSHKYGMAGFYQIGVNVSNGGHQASAASSAVVRDADLIPTPAQGLYAQAGKPFQGVVANFSDDNPDAHWQDFKATIDWGDGNQDQGVVAPAPGGGFQVSGTHTYANPGADTISVTIDDVAVQSGTNGSSAYASGPIDVMGITANDFAAIAGQPTGDLTIGQVTDPGDPYAANDLQVAISWGDGASSLATLQDNSDETFGVIGAHTYALPGDYPVEITATNGTRTVSADATAAVQAWNENTQQPGYDPQRAQMATLGEATVVLNSGDLRLSHPLDFDQSPGTSVGGDPALVYNSETVDVRPVVQVDLAGSQLAITPTQIKAQLTWGDRSPEDWVTLPVNGLPAQGGYLLTLPVNDPVTASGIYKWTVHVQLFDGTQPLDAFYHGTYQLVASDVTNSSTPDPYGAGWSIAGIDRLAVSDSGVLFIYGSGGSRFFQDAGGGSYTSPDEDFGTLARNSDQSFTYTAKDKTVSHFTSQGLLSSVVDRDGVTRNYLYSGGLLTEVDAPDGSKTFFQYNGSQTHIQEPGNRTVELDLNGADLAAIHDVDQAQSVRSFSYDSHDHLTGDQWAPLDATFHYDATSGRVTGVDRGLGTSYTITTPADPTAVALVALVHPERIASIVDGLGQSTQYTLDNRGRSTQMDQELGNAETFTRNTAGDVTQDVDPLGHATSFNYSGDGDLLGITYADGSSVSYAYDPTFHVMTQQVDERLDTTNYAIDPNNGDVLAITDALGHTTTQVWSAGLLQSVTDPLGHTTQYRYDPERRLQLTIDAIRGQTDYTYDAAGNVQTTTDPLGRVTETDYDGRNQLVQMIDAAEGVTEYQYNAYGELVSQVDPKANPSDAQGKTTLYDYDQRGFNTSIIEGAGTPVARETDLTYDAAGNLTERVSGISTNPVYQHVVTADYAYDALNRQTDVYGAGMARQTHAVYDADGNVVSVTTGIAVSDPTISHPSTTSYLYDQRNRPTDVYQAVGTPDETQTHTVYDAAGNVTSVTTGIGIGTPALSHPSTTAYVYDALNRQTQIDKAPGLPEEQIITQGYDAAGNLISSTQSTGPNSADQGRQIITQYGYDPLNRQTQVVEAYNSLQTGWGEDDQRTTVRVYDAVGNVLSVTTGIMADNAKPLTTNYTYDPLNRVLTMTEAVGTPDQRETTNVYDGAGNVQSVSKPGTFGDPVVVTAYVYDALNRPTQVTQAANVPDLARTTQTAYDAADNVVQTIDPLGIVTASVYDGFNERTATTEAVGTDVQRTTHWSYDAAGNQISVVTPRRYDNQVGPWPADDPASATSNYVYDNLNRVTDVYEAVGQPVARQTHTAYDAAGNVIAVTAGLASDPTYAHPATTVYEYDSLNRKVEEDDPATMTPTGLFSRIVVTHYDGFGDVDYQDVSDTASNPTYARTVYAYDALHRQVSITLPPGDGYQVVNGQVQITPGSLTGLTTQKVYDSQDNVILTVDPQGGRTSMVYDSFHDVTQETNPDNQSTEKTYDPADDLVQVTDADHNSTNYTYNALGEQTLVVDAANDTTQSQYDADGRLQQTTDADGRSRVFQYDALGQMTQQTWYAAPTTQGSLGTVDNLLIYGYDAADNLRSASDQNPNPLAQDGQDAVYTDYFGYNALNEMTSVQEPFGQSLAYGYDAAGNRIEVDDSQGGATKSAYDPMNELTSRTLTTGSGSTAWQATVYLAYDRNENLLKVTRTDQQAGSGTAVSAGSSVYTYDANRMETSLTNFDGNNVAQSLATMGYDTLGDVKEQYNWADTSLDPQVAATVGGAYTNLEPFSYDAAAQLTGAGNASYTPDPEGNLTGAGVVIGADNRLQEDANYTYSYDADGNLIKKVAKPAAGLGSIEWDYRYDEANRLVQAVESDTSQNQIVVEVDYSYDALGNRMERVQTSGGAQTVQRYAYDFPFASSGDGSSLIPSSLGGAGQGEGEIWADLNRSDTLQSRYLDGDSVDQMFARVDSAGSQLHWDWTDRLGSVAALTDANGEPVAFMNYDSFGNPDPRFFPTSRSVDVGRYGYTGREFDVTLGLQYNRARYYDPSTERWISQDPIGFASGDTDLYRYAGDNPTSYTDPTGLREADDRLTNRTKQLVDVSKILENHVNEVIQAAWRDSQGAGESATAFVKRVYEQLGANAPGSEVTVWPLSPLPGRLNVPLSFSPIAKIGVWLDSNLKVDENQIVKLTFAESRYGDNPLRGVAKAVWALPWLHNKETADHGIAPTIRIGDTLMGTDKWEHFFQQGYWAFAASMSDKEARVYGLWLEGDPTARGRYLGLYPKLQQQWKGINPPDKHYMIDGYYAGLSTPFGEKTWFGKYGSESTGVISYADINANDNGLKFYRNLFDAYTKGQATFTFSVGDYAIQDFNEQNVPNKFVNGLTVNDNK